MTRQDTITDTVDYTTHSTSDSSEFKAVPVEFNNLKFVYEYTRSDEIKKRQRELSKHSNIFKEHIETNDLIIHSSSSNFEKDIIIMTTDYEYKKDVPIDQMRKNFEIVFDKNMNVLINAYEIITLKTYKRVNLDFRIKTNPPPNLGPDKNSWIVVDRKKLLDSKGKDFAIKRRINVTIDEALIAKKIIINKIEKAKKTINFLKSTIGKIYDEDNFEIIYTLSIDNSCQNDINILVQFPDLMVHNSIELKRKIHNLITCVYLLDFEGPKKNKLYIKKSYIKGIRTTFNEKDLTYNWSHSHLPRGSRRFESFCMGYNHFLANYPCFDGPFNFDLIKPLESIDIEMLMIGLFNHVSWESLEGGPYYRMEDIGRGSNHTIIQNNNLNLRNYREIDYQKIFNLITEEDIKKLQTFYKLLPSGYIINRELFTKTFVEIFEDRAKEFYTKENKSIRYTYYPNNDSFISEDNIPEEKKIDQKKESLSLLRKKLSLIPIVYMNNKYIRPKLVLEDEPEEENIKVLVSFHPEIIYTIMKVIHYHLSNKLKNVNNNRKKERELSSV